MNLEKINIKSIIMKSFIIFLKMMGLCGKIKKILKGISMKMEMFYIDVNKCIIIGWWMKMRNCMRIIEIMRCIMIMVLNISWGIGRSGIGRIIIIFMRKINLILRVLGVCLIFWYWCVFIMLIMMMKINIMVVKVIRNIRDVIIISINIVNIGKVMNFGVMEIKIFIIMIIIIIILEFYMDIIS